VNCEQSVLMSQIMELIDAVVFQFRGYLPLRGIHKGRLQIKPAFSTPLRKYPSSIRYCSMVLECNSWCSQNTLLIGLIITTCSSKQRQNQKRVHINYLTLGAKPMC